MATSRPCGGAARLSLVAGVPRLLEGGGHQRARRPVERHWQARRPVERHWQIGSMGARQPRRVRTGVAEMQQMGTEELRKGGTALSSEERRWRARWEEHRAGLGQRDRRTDGEEQPGSEGTEEGMRDSRREEAREGGRGVSWIEGAERGGASEGACERTPAAGFVSLRRCSGIEIPPAARSSKESQRRNPPASDEAT